MARAGYQNNPLVELPHLNTEPTFIRATRVRADDAGGAFFLRVANPLDSDRPGGPTRSNDSASNKPINVEAQPIFKTGPTASSRHCGLPIVREAQRAGATSLHAICRRADLAARETSPNMTRMAVPIMLCLCRADN
jgi:hypothetical protein